MPKIAIVDSYYRQFLDSLPVPTGSYEAELQRLLARRFGTFDCYSFYLKQEGWDAIDLVSNYDELQLKWAMERRGWSSGSRKAILLEQIHDFNPDVLFLQDLSTFDAADLAYLSKRYLIAAQCSCAIHPGNYSDISVVFTSLPTHVDAFNSMGVRGVYLPLAFDPRVLPEVMPERQYDISFVGGIGRHWRTGNDVLERVAAEFKERFIWFGYGVENAGSALKACYAGPAFGTDMYDVYLRSKIVVNRHGEVSQGYTNNLRCFEATGCGACLFTEDSRNLHQLFHPDGVMEYSSAEDLIKTLHDYLEVEILDRHETAKIGHRYTLQEHTYAMRMKTVSEVLTTELLKKAA